MDPECVDTDLWHPWQRKIFLQWFLWWPALRSDTLSLDTDLQKDTFLLTLKWQICNKLQSLLLWYSSNCMNYQFMMSWQHIIHVLVFTCIQGFCPNWVSSISLLTHNSVFGSCLLTHLDVHFFLLACWVSVCEPEVIHFSLWVLPVHLDRDFCLTKNSDIIDSGYIWEG